MTNKKKKFVIIDALALAYKGYFAFINRPLINSKGVNTSAVFGFMNQVIKILEDTRPDYLAIAFDSKEKTFRHEMYDKYKSSREDMPEDMVPQIQMIKDIVEALNVPLYILPGYEADDLIGTACKQAAEEGYEAIAVTPDKDYVQIITENVKVVKPGTKAGEEILIYDIEKTKEVYGFEPKYMVDYLALVGDSSDDIPGVSGIGPKTASPLIAEYGTVENIYDNIDKIGKKGVVTKLENGKDNAFLSKKLARIVDDIDYDFKFENAEFVVPDMDKLNELFTEYEFKNFGAKIASLFEGVDAPDDIEAEETSAFDKKKVKYTLITTEKEAQNLADMLAKEEFFVFDTETDSLDVMNVNLVGASFCVKEGEAYFVAVNPFVEMATDLFSKDLSDRLDVDKFVEIFKSVFEDKNIKKVCQNGKYDIGVLKTTGINLKGFYFDTMLASYLIDPDNKHGMDDLSERLLNYKPISIMELIENKKTPEKIFDADLNLLSDYACEDADITYRLYKLLSKTIEEEQLNDIAYKVEFPLVEVLENMERTGVKLDIESLKKLSNDLEILLLNYTKQIHEMAGYEFNINSTQQLQKVLFDEIGLKPTKKTKTGYSTDAKSLENLKGEHEVIDLLLEYRQYSKLKSTYADALPKIINKNTGRIHTTFNQTVASTGRLSSIDPNLQNIPIRTTSGKEIRKAFIATNDDYTVFSADYSQIELRIMASICGDEGLTEAFVNGDDIHRNTAARVFKVSPDEVNQDMRRKAKEVNFGILYGIGAFGLKTRLGITQRDAKDIIDTYFEQFAKVRNFIDDSVEIAKEHGYAKTLMGRRRFLKNINSSNRVVRQFEERVAVNMPIQGTAADLIKLAMIDIQKFLLDGNYKTKMVLQVHDELVFDMYKKEQDELIPVIVDKMENAYKLNVPLKVEYGVGENWLEAH